MLKRNLAMGGLVALFLAVAIILVTPRQASASIHEIIAALCRAGGEEVVPHGQNKEGKSFVRALQEGNWRATYQSGHPGVSVMWLTALTTGPERLAQMTQQLPADARVKAILQ